MELKKLMEHISIIPDYRQAWKVEHKLSDILLLTICAVISGATGWEPVLKEAKDAEIPVFLLDRSIDVKDKSLYMTTVTADNILEGKLIGDWLVKEVNGKPCNVVELQGTVGASVAIDRKKGFAEAIKNAPNIKIIRSQSGDFTRSKLK
eukprot:130162_1